MACAIAFRIERGDQARVRTAGENGWRRRTSQKATCCWREAPKVGDLKSFIDIVEGTGQNDGLDFCGTYDSRGHPAPSGMADWE